MRSSLRIIVCVGVLAACALLAASVGVSGAPAGSAVAQTGQTADTVQVKFVIDRFVRQGRRIVAKGAVIGRYQSAERAPVLVRKPFTARVGGRTSYASTKRICTVLELTLEKLHLELLGLIVDLDKVHLLITADSNGGLLGALFCSIAGPRASAAKRQAAAAKMTRAARANRLNSNGVATYRFQVAPVLQQVPGEVCTILDLTLGPLDLNLLGLMIHLDVVHLKITAVPGGGILGDLLCSLAGGPSPPPPPPSPAFAPSRSG
jgi:hypothetical protein